MAVGGLLVRKRNHEARLVRFLPQDLNFTSLFFQVGNGCPVLRLEVRRRVYRLGRREGRAQHPVRLRAATEGQEGRERQGRSASDPQAIRTQRMIKRKSKIRTRSR